MLLNFPRGFCFRHQPILVFCPLAPVQPPDSTSRGVNLALGILMLWGTVTRGEYSNLIPNKLYPRPPEPPTCAGASLKWLPSFLFLFFFHLGHGRQVKGKIKPTSWRKSTHKILPIALRNLPSGHFPFFTFRQLSYFLPLFLFFTSR